jgi:hypothetical protein
LGDAKVRRLATPSLEIDLKKLAAALIASLFATVAFAQASAPAATATAPTTTATTPAPAHKTTKHMHKVSHHIAHKKAPQNAPIGASAAQ